MTPLRISYPTLAAAIMAACTVPSVFAEEIKLDDVVVTASGAAVDIADAPASVSIVTREEIEKRPFDNVSDLLKTLPGVSGGRGSAGVTSKIALRGLPDQYTLILVDGKRIGNTQYTTYRENLARQDLDWISPEMIERIEIVRGPMSSLYGSDAMGGVINIITKKDFSKKTASISVGYTKPEDSYRGSTKQVSFLASTPINEKIGVRLSGSYLHRISDESVGSPEYVTTSYILGTPGIRQNNLNALFDFKILPNQKIEFEVGKSVQKNEASQKGEWKTVRGVLTWVPEVDAFGGGNLHRDTVGFTHSAKIFGGESKISAYNTVAKEKDSTSNTFGAKYKELVVDGKFDKALNIVGVDQALTFGFQWKEDDIENPSNIGNLPPAVANAITGYTGSDGSAKKLSSRTAAIFMEDQLFWNEKFSTTVGARLDDSDRFGSHFSPRVYAVYHPVENWTVKGGYSEGFRAPSAKESSVSAATYSGGNGCRSIPGYNNGGCYMLGNPNLKPEESNNYEIAFGYLNDLAKVNLTYFHTDFKNKIDYRPLGKSGGYWFTQKINISKARTRGVELDYSYQALSNLRLSGAVTRIFESKNLIDDTPLLAVPKLNASFDVNWQVTPSWTSFFAAHYTGKQATVAPNSTSSTYASGFTTFDWGVNYEYSKKMTFKAGINNLSNKQSREGNNQFDAGGRSYYVGLTAKY